MPPRILRFRLHLMRFSYVIQHVPGKELYTANALSRAPLPTSGDSQTKLIEQFVNTVMSTLPASTERLQEYCTAQLKNTNCVQLVDLCRNGWPKHKHQVPKNVQPYWSVRGELSLQGDLLLRGRRIVVPKSLQKETLQNIHSGHQGITKCSLYEPLPLSGGQDSNNNLRNSFTTVQNAARQRRHRDNPSSPHPFHNIHGKRWLQTYLRWMVRRIC